MRYAFVTVSALKPEVIQLDSNGPLREDTLLADLSRLPWAKGLDETAIQEIVDASDCLRVGEGEVIHRAGDTLAAVYLVTRGRIWASVVDLFGKTVLERPLVRGGSFGLFSVAQGEDSVVTVTAMEPSTLLKLSFEGVDTNGGNLVLQIVLDEFAGHKSRPSALMLVRPRCCVSAGRHQG